MAVGTAEFVKALKSLEEAMAESPSDLARDAAIQRFEFTVELAWKVCKKLMGTNTTAPKDVIREMAQNRYIQNIDLWLKAIDQRNLSSHTYNESLAKDVYSFISEFLPEAKMLKEKLSSG